MISNIDPDFDYVSCTSDCEAKHLGSIPGETMRAETSLGVGGDTLPIPSGFDTDAFTAPAWGGGSTTIQGLSGTQMAVSSAYKACMSGCMISNADPDFDYVSCTSDCEAKHLGSIPGETMRAETSLGVGGDTLPMPSGFDTDAFTAPAWGGGSTTIQGLSGTQMAVSSAYKACMSGCMISNIDPDFDYVSCTSDCEAKHLGSIPGETMRAETSLGVGGDTLPMPSGFDADNQAGGSRSPLTRIASSIRLGDPQPMCGTDAWACFNGTDDESPMIRNIGIFASNRPCMHPSCD